MSPESVRSVGSAVISSALHLVTESLRRWRRIGGRTTNAVPRPDFWKHSNYVLEKFLFFDVVPSQRAMVELFIWRAQTSGEPDQATWGNVILMFIRA